ncbi:MAG: SPASM domain-containing protein [Pirellulaceae bacterium]|nr:SPASM domain-containing protein [Pirellulaceae bacterium]
MHALTTYRDRMDFAFATNRFTCRAATWDDIAMDWSKIRPWLLPSAKQPQGSAALRPGLFHYRRQRDGELVRYHLRIENSGQSLLLVAAIEAVRLTRSGTLVAYGLLEGHSQQQILQSLAGAPNPQGIVNDVRKMLAELGSPSKRYPIFNLTDPMVQEYPQGLIAPFQADVESSNVVDLRRYLQALWDAGIPHVRFVPSLDNDDQQRPEHQRLERWLPEAVQMAGDMGMITGVRLSAQHLVAPTQLIESTLLDRLSAVGLDYVVVPWGVSRQLHERLMGPADYDCLNEVITCADRWEISTVLEAGLTPESVDVFEVELDRVTQRGIEYVEVFAIAQPLAPSPATAVVADSSDSSQPPTAFQAQAMRQLAGWIEDVADSRQVNIIWLPPHSSRSPLTADRIGRLLRAGPRAGADISIRVAAAGQVYPPRGERVAVGQIHLQPWQQIWNHPSFQRFREMVDRNEHCQKCTFMTVCAAHCPADPAGWAIEN